MLFVCADFSPYLDNHVFLSLYRYYFYNDSNRIRLYRTKVVETTITSDLTHFIFEQFRIFFASVSNTAVVLRVPVLVIMFNHA
jgi:hypothetical protein